jgi:hypothetical protein
MIELTDPTVADSRARIRSCEPDMFAHAGFLAALARTHMDTQTKRVPLTDYIYLRSHYNNTSPLRGGLLKAAMASLLGFLYKRRRNEDDDVREDHPPPKRQVYVYMTFCKTQDLS